ncbi:hypothetical protein L596_010092 [Steinernema carpocapsae]|uniref:Uncharacterized protein n=1 Tax=Steinernema carpocapsae TaxID=34508 RepID=A0A4U5PHA7_STECR|nr:hypothetical protein L596_010092 [Steinernema carpocapsae]
MDVVCLRCLEDRSQTLATLLCATDLILIESVQTQYLNNRFSLIRTGLISGLFGLPIYALCLTHKPLQLWNLSF